MSADSTVSPRDIVNSHFVEHTADIVRHMQEVWDHPELAGVETKSVDLLCQWLERSGFEVTKGVGGIPTAFACRTGHGKGPRIAILAEYDALPGLGNEAVPQKKPTGTAAGHGCGHNQIAAANVGAAIIAANAAKEAGIDVQIEVLGCPAEEILWGKIAMLERGVFEGFDAILTSHGDYQNGVLSRPCQSGASGEVVFYGIAGHAGSNRRQNALDAAELAVQSLERLRAHNFPNTIVEHVLRVAGVHPSITPDETRLWLSVRHENYEQVCSVYDFAVSVCERAAEMTGTTFRHQFISATHGYLPNDALADLLFECQREVGPPKWSAEDLAWMRDLASTCAPRDQFVLDQDIDLYKTGVESYAQDDGELSWRIPLARVNWAYPNQVPLHHWALTAISGHASSFPGPLMAAETLAYGALELARRPDVLKQAWKELRERTRDQIIAPPRVGAMKTFADQPQTFWDKTWIED